MQRHQRERARSVQETDQKRLELIISHRDVLQTTESSLHHIDYRKSLMVTLMNL